MATFTLVDLDQQAAPIELVVGEVDDWIRHHGHRQRSHRTTRRRRRWTRPSDGALRTTQERAVGGRQVAGRHPF